jgi:catecholate siderophore receptor
VTIPNTVTSARPAWGTKQGPLNQTELALAGVYVQDQIEIGRHFEIIGGIRFDRFDLDFHDSNGASRGRVDDVWSPRVGAVFKPLDYLSLYISYSKSFLPFSGEQFSTLSTQNANLAPEEFINREIGFKWDITPRLAFTGALFMLDRENQSVAITPTENTQIGKTRTEGGELTLTGYLTEDWEVVAGYGYQRAEVLEGGKTVSSTTGKEVALVPHHTFSLWNKYHFLENWAAGVGVVSRTGMYAQINNQVTLPGFARLDAALFWDINENLEAQINVENVLDTEYYSTAHNNNNITPGSPRAYFATVTSRF